MKVHTPARLAVLTRLVSLVPSGTFALMATILSASLLTTGIVAVHATDAGSSDEPNAIQTSRRTITVLGIGDLDDKGQSHVTSMGKEDAVVFSLTEAAITKSHAYRLVSRDQMPQQVKEIKFDSEGWVKPATAQKFGKSTGIQNFATVFISNVDTKSLTDTSGASNIPKDGTPVPAEVTGEPSRPGARLEKLPINKFGAIVEVVKGIYSVIARKKTNNTNNFTASQTRNLSQASYDIVCRLTKVESSDRETLTFSGWAVADGGVDPHSVHMAALKNAFDNLSRYMKKNRPPLVGNITDVTDKKAIVDIGETDGLKPDMIFEICETKKVGSFTTYDHICDACVLQVSPTTALLDIGEFKKNKFHQKDDKAKSVHKGLVIREKTS